MHRKELSLGIHDYLRLLEKAFYHYEVGRVSSAEYTIHLGAIGTRVMISHQPHRCYELHILGIR